jgi:endonuclease/exonuclease/phosphatase family metal-dependent hydrolase
VVALQELETGQARSAGVHQAKHIAELLRFEYHFHSVRELKDEQFGNAVLSRFPMKLLRAGGLPSLTDRGSETRGALWVELDVNGTKIQLVNTHFGLRPREKALQAEALLGERWLGAMEPDVPVILLGDFNSGPRSPAYRRFLARFQDCQVAAGAKPKNTWFTKIPIARLDHIFIRPPLKVLRSYFPSFQLAAMASDHFPVVADIAFPGAKHDVA